MNSYFAPQSSFVLSVELPPSVLRFSPFLANRTHTRAPVLACREHNRRLALTTGRRHGRPISARFSRPIHPGYGHMTTGFFPRAEPRRSLTNPFPEDATLR